MYTCNFYNSVYQLHFILKQEIEKNLTGIGERENGEVQLTGYGISVWGDERALKTDTGNGSTAL